MRASERQAYGQEQHHDDVGRHDEGERERRHRARGARLRKDGRP